MLQASAGAFGNVARHVILNLQAGWGNDQLLIEPVA
jgi:hypothetical protein